MHGSPLVEMVSISKAYPGCLANDAVDIKIHPGRVHALLGENGAGKSTLVKILYGLLAQDSGTIQWQGKPVDIASPAVARELGIAMVFQHFSLFESLSVLENIALGMDADADAVLKQKIIEVSARYGLPLDPDRSVYSLSVGERQRIEIVRCLLQEPKLLIMDEPTSVLPPQGVQQLFDTLRTLRENGCSILYISHKLEEIRQLCDNATVLRAGKVVGKARPSEHSNESLAHMMIGRSIPPPEHAIAEPSSEIRLQIKKLKHTPIDPFGTALKNIDLTVYSGEIVGIAGVSGNGQKELMRLISGEDLHTQVNAGSLSIGDDIANTLNPIQRRSKGLGFVPEERLGRGAVPDLSLSYNGLLTAYKHGLTVLGMIRFNASDEFAQQCIDDNDVRCGGTNSMAGSLSGGNLQKFIVGREIALKPSLLVLSQPTWGLDVGAANNIRNALINLRDSGASVLLVSEELEELFEVSDRLHVIYDGHLSPSLNTRETTSTQVGQWMTGEFLHDAGAA